MTCLTPSQCSGNVEIFSFRDSLWLWASIIHARLTSGDTGSSDGHGEDRTLLWKQTEWSKGLKRAHKWLHTTREVENSSKIHNEKCRFPEMIQVPPKWSVVERRDTDSWEMCLSNPGSLKRTQVWKQARVTYLQDLLCWRSMWLSREVRIGLPFREVSRPQALKLDRSLVSWGPSSTLSLGVCPLPNQQMDF